MRIAVAGATGRIGRLTVAALDRAGHQAVPVSRGAGEVLLPGDGARLGPTTFDDWLAAGAH